MANLRKLKIQSKYFSRAWNYAVFPEIRLAGKWLQDLGFTCGSFVTIVQQEKSITITVIPDVEAQPVIKKRARKEQSILSPELDDLPINQLFQHLAAEDYHEYLGKTKGKKK